MLDNKEIWKDCKGYEGLYQISSLGRVWSVRLQRMLKPYNSGGGSEYKKIDLIAKNGKRKKEYVHRLVALAFIPNPEPQKFTMVNHKDEVKTNNCVDNLEWCDAKYNNNYGTAAIRTSITLGTPVYCIEMGQVYLSSGLACKALGIKSNHISFCCQNRDKTCGGYHWCYWSEINDKTSHK